MTNSILASIKKDLGDCGGASPFDDEIITQINSVLMELEQMGVGVKGGLFITDETATWDDFSEDNKIKFMAHNYVYLRTKIVFDPPQSSYLLESLNRVCDRLEYRLMRNSME